ncbi:MAG: hypothetical protein PF508_08670 [Spirochaeta sp.]|jgi:DNA-binding beta-propeller fold protein YncE|nr:hypothetical protein [Spirochaeta sp.]
MMRRSSARGVSRTCAAVLLAMVMIALFGGAGSLSAQAIDMDAAEAAEEFRWGVRAFHAGRFNDAIVAFTRAIAFKPDDLRAREWLGRAYFHSGLVEAALDEWSVIAESGEAGAYLLSRLEQIRFRRGTLPLLPPDLKISRSQQVGGTRGQTVLFRRPGGMAAEPGGDFFLVSLGTQEVLRITPNGRIRRRIRGGLPGLDKPFDVEWREGRLYVTEFGRDQIAVLDDTGGRVGTIGAPGLGDGELLGPQYLAIDGDGFVYVTEWGSRRVSKFAPDGEFSLSFGPETRFFSGLQRPTGIAIRDETVYVADTDDRGPALHLFDTSGNHMERIPLPLTAEDRPEYDISGAVVEDIAWYDETLLLITAGYRVLLFDPDRESVEAEINDQQRQRVASAVRDANRRVLVSDFDADDFSIFEPEGTLYAGLDVRIERIVTAAFPQVGVLVAVHDRNGRPIVGLETANFIISENGRPENNAQLESAGQVVTSLDTVALLQPRSGQSYTDDAARAVSDLVSVLPSGDRMDLYVAGREPTLVSRRPASADLFADRTARALVERDQLFAADEVALDRSIRVAAAELLESGLRRNLVLIGDGRVGDTAFQEYSIDQLAAFLSNNEIGFHIVLLEQRTPDAELSYLVEQTGGTIRYVYEPQGVAPIVEDFRRKPLGTYWLTYTSAANPDFGRAFIEVSAEARIFVRSGRDEMGFFPPAES